MGEENNLPNQEQTPPEKSVPQVEQSQKEKQPAQPLPPELEARVQQLITENTQRAIEQAKEMGRRELQAQQERNKAEALRLERRAKQAEARLGAYDSGVAGLDEEARAALEHARVKGENQYYQGVFQEEENRRNAEAYAAQLKQSLRDEATALGLDPNDNRIDYASDEGDYFKGRQRFTGSLSKILKSNQDSATQQMRDSFKTLELNLRKELGFESVPPSSGASIDTSEATFIKEYNEGLRNNPADHKRAREYLNKLNK